MNNFGRILAPTVARINAIKQFNKTTILESNKSFLINNKWNLLKMTLTLIK